MIERVQGTTHDYRAARPSRLGFVRNLPHWWRPALFALVTAYLVLGIAVFVGSPMNSVDAFWYDQHLVPSSSPWHAVVSAVVFIGRRLPATIVVSIYVLHRTIQTRSWRPAVMFAIGWFAFNASVGAIKYLTGRVGPRYTSDAHTLFAGGDIFPSGHVTGAVVIYGVMALVAPAVHRRLMTAFAIAFSVVVGFGTVALNTHWLSDVFGGWINGLIVLMVTWAITPWAARKAELLAKRAWFHVRRWWETAPVVRSTIRILDPRI